MNEFQKPYEYSEDKRGAILYFVIMLISLDVFLAITYAVQVSNAFYGIPSLYYCTLAINILYLLFIIYTSIICLKMKKKLVITSEIYLIVRALYSTISALIVYYHAIQAEGSIGEGNPEDKIWILTLQILIVPLTCVFLISVAWFLYFSKSKRCKEIVKG